MPKALERKLRATARKRGYSGRKASAYVYGGLRNSGWTPKTTGRKRRKRRR